MTISQFTPTSAQTSLSEERHDDLLQADRWLWTLLLVSLAVKLILAFVVRDGQPVLDQGAYLDLARGIVDNGSYEGTFRPPLYPLFMSAFLAIGAGTLGIRIALVVLSTISVLLIYRVGAAAFGRRAGRIAAAIFAFDPILVSFSHNLWSETLFIFLLLLLLDRLLVAARTGAWHQWITAGIILGLAGLTRPMILTFAPLLLPWAMLHARGHLAWSGLAMRFAALTIACCAVVLPWTIRNYLAYDEFILVDTNGAFNFLVGTQPEAAFVDKDDVWSERFGRVDGQRYEELQIQSPGIAQDAAMTAAWHNIAENPTRFAAKSLWEAGHLWTLDSFLLRHLRNGWYGGTARRLLLPPMTILATSFFALLVIFGLFGLTAAPASPIRALGLLLIGHSLVLFGLTYALSRYSVPLHVVLALFAGFALANVRAAQAQLREQSHRTRRLMVAAGMALLIGSAWVRDIPMLADMLTNRGAEHRYRYERVEAPGNVTARAQATGQALK